MKPWMMAGSTALALLYATGAVQADVTPEDVWANWKSMSEGYGQPITTESESRDGDTLVIKGLSMIMDKDGSKAAGRIDELRLKDMGDGTVQVTQSDTYTVSIETPAIEGQSAAKMALTIGAPGMTTLASGTPDAVSYDMTAPTLTVHAEGADAADATKGAVSVDVTLTDTKGAYKVAKGEAGSQIDYNITSKSADIAFTGKDSTDGTDVSLKMTVADVTGTSSGMFLGAEAMADMAAAMKAGFGFSSNLNYGAGSYEINAVTEGQPAKISGTIGSGSFAAAMDKGAFSLQTGSKDVTLAVESAAIPIPDLTASFGESGFNMLMPLMKSDAPSDFNFGVKLTDLKISDSIWSMIDPTGALPHDPATLVIDTKGQATLTADLTDPAAMEAMAGTPPGMLNAFDLNLLNLKIAGAEVTGTGAFTFDNNDMTTFPGMPAPTGQVDLKASGINGLIDKLVSMGLVPEDQAMQGKMMLGMFAQPGEGEDTLTSSIQVGGGKLTINGMEMPMQ